MSGAFTLSIGIQKGGAGKTTATACIAYLLAHTHGKRVLCVDMDAQCNLTELFTRAGGEYWRTHSQSDGLSALTKGNLKGCIKRLSDTLYLLPGSDLMGTMRLPPFTITSLKSLLSTIKSEFDYILIDTPPSLGEQLIVSLAASDGALTILETSSFCYRAVPQFFSTITTINKKYKQAIVNIGIILVAGDTRRTDTASYIQLAKDTYGNLVFNDIVRKSAAAGRLGYTGLNPQDNPEVSKAVERYKNVTKELMNRVGNTAYKTPAE